MGGKVYVFFILLLISANMYYSRVTGRVKRSNLVYPPSRNFSQVSWQLAKNNAPPASSYHFNKDQLIVSELDDKNATVVMLWNKEESLTFCQQVQMRFLVANEDVILYWDKVKQNESLPAETVYVPTSKNQTTNIFVGKHGGSVGTIESTNFGEYDLVVYTASEKKIFETPDCDFEVLCANRTEKAGVVINSGYRGKL